MPQDHSRGINEVTQVSHMGSHMMKLRSERGTQYCYDSANPVGIPAGAQYILPYGDGRYAWGHMRFPNARYRYITVEGNPEAGSIIDVEPGLVTNPDTIRNFVRERNKLHGDATVYTFRYEYDNIVRPALIGFTYSLLIATLDETRLTSYHGKDTVGCQYYNQPQQEFDLSAIWDTSWLHPSHNDQIILLKKQPDAFTGRLT